VPEIVVLLRQARARQRSAAELLQAAHAALDRGDYDQAVATHKKADQAQAEADAASREFENAFGDYLAARLRDLDHDSPKVRDQATAELRKLGPWAVPWLKQAGVGRSVEVQQGRLHQWAIRAKASSEYGNPDWSASQATGKPDTLQAGDLNTAWASMEADGGEEWLELTYETPVHPVAVRIRETFNPGAVVKVEAQDAQGMWHTLWTGKDPAAQAPAWLEVSGAGPAWTCKVVKVTLDTAAVPGWNEIDAVELVGLDPGSDQAASLRLQAATGSAASKAATAPAWEAKAVEDPPALRAAVRPF
jgi:hypothetical protein